MELKFSFFFFKIITFFLVVCLALGFCSFVSAQEADPVINVAYFVSSGGLLWVNGSSVVNGSVVAYSNGTVLALSATPTNASYSYGSMVLNGTVTSANPVFYNLSTSEFGVSNQTVLVNFVAEDDAVLGVAISLGLVAVGVCVVLVFVVKRREE